MPYDLTDHELLSAKAAALSAEALAAWTRVAEYGLGIVDQVFDATGAADAEHALALTVNAFVEHGGKVVTAKSRGAQSESYAVRASELADLIPAPARALVEKLVGARPGASATPISFAW